MRGGSGIAAAALVLAAYVAVLRLVPTDVFWHPDEGAKFLTVAAIEVREGLRYRVPYAGAALDPELRFYLGRGEHGYLFPMPAPADEGLASRWPILFPLLAKPLYATFGATGLYVLPVLGGWMTALLSGWIVHRCVPGLAPVGILLVGLATPVAFYSVAFLEHTLALAFGMAALALALRPPAAALRPLVLASLAVAVVLRVEMALFALAVLLAPALAGRGEAGRSTALPAGFRGRRAAALLLGLAALLLLALIVPGRYRDLLAALPADLPGNLRKLAYLPHAAVHILLHSPAPEASSVERPGAWVALGALGIALAAPLARRRALDALLVLPALAVLLEFSLRLALSTRPFIDRQGVLPLAPYIVVGSQALVLARRGDRRLGVVVAAAAGAAVLGFLGLFTFKTTFDGGYHVGLDGGARYVLGLYPLGVILSLVVLHAYRESDRPAWMRSSFTVLVAAMMIVGALTELRGVRRLYESRALITRWAGALGEEGAVVSDAWWLLAEVAPRYVSQPMYLVEPVDRLPEWLALAEAGGVREFTLATFERLPTAILRRGTVQARVEEERVVEGMHVLRLRLGPRPPADAD